MRRLSGVKVTLTVLAVVIAVLVGGFVHRMLQPVIFSKQQMENYGAFLFEKPRIFREVTLVDQNGRALNRQFFSGKWTLVFFGFTYCPDICPTTMGVLNKFYEELKKEGAADDVQVVLVSVDPERDTPEKMRDYVAYFNPLFFGVTGDYMELVKLSGDLNAAFTRVPLAEGGYLMEHSANIALINPRGDYHGFFRPPFDALRLQLAFDSARAQYRRDYGE